MEYSPVPCIRRNSFCCVSGSLGFLPRRFPYGSGDRHALAGRILIKSTSNSVKVARMLKNILPIGSERSYTTALSASFPPFFNQGVGDVAGIGNRTG